jgi:hypothetical protein
MSIVRKKNATRRFSYSQIIAEPYNNSAKLVEADENLSRSFRLMKRETVDAAGQWVPSAC